MCMGMHFIPSADVYLKNFFYYYYHFILVLLFTQVPFLVVFTILYENYRLFSASHDTPALENMLCVDLSYLIFRTCLALIKAMMVCMGKDHLAYTAAMAVEVISRKVIYKLSVLRFIECYFRTD